MFNITNSRKVGDLAFHTAKGRPVNLRPLRSMNFEVEDMSIGLLRSMTGKGSHFTIRADSEEAENLLKLAKEPKGKRLGSPIVHGATEPRSPNFVSVRDLKNPRPKEGETEKVFIKEEQLPQTPAQPEQQPPPPPPEKSALELLIDNSSALPFGEFRSQAKEQLGDEFPTGTPGRQALVELLKAKLAQPAVATQE